MLFCPATREAALALANLIPSGVPEGCVEVLEHVRLQ